MFSQSSWAMPRPLAESANETAEEASSSDELEPEPEPVSGRLVMSSELRNEECDLSRLSGGEFSAEGGCVRGVTVPE